MEAISGQLKILVVDSEELILRYLPLAFRECTVLTARQGPEALRLLQIHPDIAVLMADPAASGYSLLEFCRAKFPHMRQILVSRATGAAQPPRAVNQAFRVLTKPCHESELVQALRQALDAGDPAGPPDRRWSARRAESPPPPATAAAETASRFKDELVAVAAHELRAPLAVIQGYAGILRDSEPGLSAEGRLTVERIGAVSMRLLGMVNSMLNLAAVEAGKVELEFSNCRPGEVVSAMFDSLRGLTEERGVRCRLKVEGEDREVSLDRGKLEQILQNLLSNAIKFNVPGGTVDVEVRRAQDAVEFTVRDTGIGFAPEDIPRAFAKFTRFAANSQPGSGLGLAIAKALVELQGGKIRLESTQGQGSVFHFTLVPGFRGGKPGPLLA